VETGLPVQVRRSRIADWLGRLCVRRAEIDGVVRHDDGECFHVHVALPGFAAGEIGVSVASDHVVIDARGLHLILPFAEPVRARRAAARLHSGVLSIRVPRS
jgi:HSP20 family molecular chaperone IbpA